MNAPNINAPNAGDPIGKNRGVSPRKETERTANVTAGRDTANATPDIETTERETVRSADTFQATRDRDLVRTLTDAIEREDAPVRDEAVARARSRMSEGYYSTPDFMGSLASRLISSDRI